jgi:uncharacterized protein
MKPYMDNKIFVDTSWFKGFIDEKDDFHRAAKIMFEEANNEGLRFVTTNFIIDETFTLLRQRCADEKVKFFYHTLARFGERLRIVRVGVMDEKRVWEWFWKPWTKLSYTDCTSFAVMERLELKDVLTFDEHFAQAGFEIFK